MHTELYTLIETIKNDYTKWQGLTLTHSGKNEEEKARMLTVQAEMNKEFVEGIEVLPGKKYIKIVIKKSVWGFVVNVDNDKKFRRGDILKPAGYNAPARNAARGNILKGGYSISWTGPHYL